MKDAVCHVKDVNSHISNWTAINSFGNSCVFFNTHMHDGSIRMRCSSTRVHKWAVTCL